MITIYLFWSLSRILIAGVAPGTGGYPVPDTQGSLPAAVDSSVVYYTESGTAKFTSRVPLHSFTGESQSLTGMIDLAENVVDFYIDLSTLRTGVGRRDRDMFRTLNVDEHPYAEFTGSLETPFDADSDRWQDVTVTGEFRMHGRVREMSIDGRLRKQGTQLTLEAEWSLFLDDFGIEPPGILFYRVNEEQEIEIEAVLRETDRDELLSGG